MASACAGAWRRGMRRKAHPPRFAAERDEWARIWPAMGDTDVQPDARRTAAVPDRSAEFKLLPPRQEAAARDARAVDDFLPGGQLVRAHAQQDRDPSARHSTWHLPDLAGCRDRVRRGAVPLRPRRRLIRAV